MADLLTPGIHPRESEFVWDPAQGRWLTGTCGQQALAMAAWNATGKETHTLDVYRLMRAHGLCDVNGASTPDQLKAAAQLLGLTITEYQPVWFGWPGWQAFLARHAGKDVVVWELHNGQALVDEISGLGENAVNLQNHYICGYGASGDGWLFADGDNYAGGNTSANGFRAADVLQRYSFSTLANAMPCAAIAIHVPGGGPMAWHQQSDRTGKDDKGHSCGAGDMDYLDSAGLASSDGLASETPYEGPNTFLPLDNGHIVTAERNADGTWSIGQNGAQVLVNVWSQLQVAKGASVTPVPLSPYQLAAIAAAEASMAAQSALASATALKGK